MRTGRYHKFKKIRQKRRRSILLLTVLLPSTFIVLGLILLSLSLLPSSGK